MTVVRAVAEASARLGFEGRPVLVAVSGGVDSTVLAHALRELSERSSGSSGSGPKISLGHVNHGLRGEESDADAAFVATLARDLSVRALERRVDPRALRAGRSSRQRPTLQEAARSARYAALFEMAREIGAERIATAHTADDQAETVLLRLLRGTGPDGLRGIPERSEPVRGAGIPVVRPLLRVTRRDIESFARDRRLSWREDPSNGSTAYSRNRLRRDWIPGLSRAFNPQLLRAIGDLAEAQQRDAEWIGGLVEREAALRFSREGAWLRIDLKDWGTVPEALARRLARAALGRCGAGRHVSRVHLMRMLAFLRGSRPGTYIELPAGEPPASTGLRLERDRVGVRLGPLPAAEDVRSASPSEGAC